jgi:hypothetical protein
MDGQSTQHQAKSGEKPGSIVLLTAIAVGLFLVLHPYLGLIHDARLYTIQALSHLQPALYGNDIFVRFGSQDNYTLFSPLYAAIISRLGVEPAAAVLTFSGVLLFLVAFWMLARTLVPQQQAVVALLLLLLIPAYYGPAKIFHYLEEFVTPRQLSEALGLFGLATLLRSKPMLAVLFATAAMLIHPIIGLSGITLMTVYSLLPHWRRAWPLCAIAAALTAMALLGWLPISRWQFDPQWYEIVKMRSYLNLRNWDIEDWGRIVTVAATLAIAALSLEHKLRRIALAALVASSLLVLLAFIGGDLLRIVIVVQAQPWRALWLATVIAVLLLPPTYVAGWCANQLSRCSLLLLAAAWAMPHSVPPLILAALAIVAMTFRTRPLLRQHGRLLEGGAWVAQTMVVVHSLAIEQLAVEEGLTQLESLPPQLDRLLTLSHNGVIPGLALLVVGYAVARVRFPLFVPALTAAIMAMIAVIAMPVAETWAATRYDGAIKESFAAWRARIPPGSEVLWADTQEVGAPGTWLLLERPSYMSTTQAPNALFSRTAAIEMARRAAAISRVLPVPDPFHSTKGRQLEIGKPLLLKPICTTLNVRYVVTSETLADATPILAPSNAPFLYRQSKLYICP